MRIVHVVEAFGGGIVEFIRLLVKFQSNNNHIIIYGQREIDIDTIKMQFNANAEFVSWKNAQREISICKDISAFLELSEHLSKISSFDALHLHSSKAGFLGRILGLKYRNTNIIYTPHGLSFEMTGISYTKRFLYSSLEYIASKISGRVICVSQSEATAMRMIGVKANYINNGIDCSAFLKDNIKTSNEKTIVITVGRISTQKNPKLFNEFAMEFPDTDFYWIGDGNEIEKRNLSAQNIYITGWLPKDELNSFLKKENAIYLSTALWEGLPFSIIESMIFKKPLVVSNCTGNIDLVIHNQNGYIYKNKQEGLEYLNILLVDAVKRKEFGEYSNRFVFEYFNAEQMAKQYDDFYKKRG